MFIGFRAIATPAPVAPSANSVEHSSHAVGVEGRGVCYLLTEVHPWSSGLQTLLQMLRTL